MRLVTASALPTTPVNRQGAQQGDHIVAPKTSAAPDVAKQAEGPLVAERYRLLGSIGRGGVATVFRAEDLVEDRTVALKRLLPIDKDSTAATAMALFEREYQALAQLSHPHVVEVYDYGVDEGHAFYTMELLSGGDLGSLSPLSFDRACALMRDIGAALSLLHSRRFVHRDISPRNVRCTDCGLGKLIDFGAMASMGVSTEVVGTPPFCAPEVLDMRPLDARTDLYALGGTLYYALTGHHAYPARDFKQLRHMWNDAPPSPSQLGVDVPKALDDLVMELIQLDPANRPDNAAVVIERLSAIAGLSLDETLIVPEAYLSTPTLVGRDRKIARVRRMTKAAQQGNGATILVEAAGGLGRTRFLEACSIEAKLTGMTVVRALCPDGNSKDYAAAHVLGRQLLQAHPETGRARAMPYRESLGQLLAELGPDESTSTDGHPEAGGRALQLALRSWILDVSDRHPLLIVADDVERLDEPSIALLSLLADETANHPIAILASTAARVDTGGSVTLEVLARLSTRITLDKIGRKSARQMLGSMFGEVSHLDFVAGRLHEVADGNPRDLMHLARHLIDRGVVACRGGSWELPSRIDTADLPDSLARALSRQVEDFDPLALELAQAHALCPDSSFSMEQCVSLSGHSRRAVMAALDQLARTDVLRTEGGRYKLGQAGWIGPLLDTLAPEDKPRLHARIAILFAHEGDEFRHGQHLLLAGQGAAGLEILVKHAVESKALTDNDPVAWYRFVRALPPNYPEVCEAALALCAQLERPEANSFALRTRMSSVYNVYGRSSRHLVEAVLAQCRKDAGLDLYDPQLPAQDRLKRMFEAAQARHDALPAQRRVFAPLAAPRPLASVTIETLGICSNHYDVGLWKQLPDLSALTPLAPTFEVLDEVRRALGKRLQGHFVEARAGYSVAIERLEQPDRAGLPESYHEGTLASIKLSRALVDTLMGAEAVLETAEEIESSWSGATLGTPLLRMLHCLSQGDGEGADRQRKEFELRLVQSNSAVPYEGCLVFTELCLLSMCDDLSRLRRLMPMIERWAAMEASWTPMLCYAWGQQRRMGGNFEDALEATREGLSRVSAGHHQLWAPLAGAELECLLGLGRAQDAISLGRRYRTDATAHGVDFPLLYVEMPLSLALCAAGEVDEARQLAEHIIEMLSHFNSTGVLVGLAFHNLARICLADEDSEGFQEAAGQCAQVFEHSTSQALSSKYRRLMREARKAHRSPGHEFDFGDAATWQTGAAKTFIHTAFKDCTGLEQRAHVAGQLIARCCKAESVFVYVPVDGTATLAATIGGYPAPPQLAELVDDLMAAELGEGSDMTATCDDDSTGRARRADLAKPQRREFQHGPAGSPRSQRVRDHRSSCRRVSAGRRLRSPRPDRGRAQPPGDGPRCGYCAYEYPGGCATRHRRPGFGIGRTPTVVSR